MDTDPKSQHKNKFCSVSKFNVIEWSCCTMYHTVSCVFLQLFWTNWRPCSSPRLRWVDKYQHCPSSLSTVSTWLWFKTWDFLLPLHYTKHEHSTYVDVNITVTLYFSSGLRHADWGWGDRIVGTVQQWPILDNKHWPIWIDTTKLFHHYLDPKADYETASCSQPFNCYSFIPFNSKYIYRLHNNKSTSNIFYNNNFN